MAHSWSSIANNEVVTHQELQDQVTAGTFSLKAGQTIPLGASADLALTKTRALSYVNILTTNATLAPKPGNEVVTKQDLTPLSPTLSLEYGTKEYQSWLGLATVDRANINYYDTATTYTVGKKLVYSLLIKNTGTLATQGNTVVTITLPSGTSVDSVVPTHLTAGEVSYVEAVNTVTITITKQIGIYNASTYPLAWTVSLILNHPVPMSPAHPYSISFPTTITTPYGTNSPLATTKTVSMDHPTLTVSKTSSYAAGATIPYNTNFDYTITAGISNSHVAINAQITDTLNAALTFVSIVSTAAGWTSNVTGQVVTFTKNEEGTSENPQFVIRVKSNTENVNITNRAIHSASNAYTSVFSDRSNYLDYNRVPSYTSQGYTTCYNGTNQTVYRDTNVNSTTYQYYYVIQTGSYVLVSSSGAPANGLCYWDSEYRVATLSGSVTRTRNNCGAGSTASTVTINPGDVFGISPTGQFRSYTSQADANAQAQAYAESLLQTNLQNYANTYGTCTWSSTQTRSYSQGYVKNNCASNCYGSGTIYYSNDQTRSATSQISQADADSKAAADALAAATAVVQANGQSYANSTGSCCCWNYEEYCSGCQRRSRERNSCTNELRNDGLVANNSCTCGNTCAGTYWSYYCTGTTRMRELRYNCDGSYAGTTETYQTCSGDCGANTLPAYTYQGYTSCQSCYNAPVYKDTNSCSGTYNQYYIENQSGNKVYVGGQPSGGSCNTSSNCQDTGSAYCSGSNWVINRYQANPCSGEGCASPRVIEYNSTANGCYTPPACKIYEVFMFGSNAEYINFHYQDCYSGTMVYTNTYNDGGGGSGGTYCALEGTAYIDSGSAGFFDTGDTCGNT